ncbi:hypothetical protein BC937DRAFT_88728 [Endogone sp. FLAS-F59071]|nr:hypothetical protein BC937DRAFT_88728 [Endogone sp. FLAS-F59071]|eukprot:RUS18485.1 hypothetical protein BC937DRAFT_88728 [Endogone sp. FLAS-F59071]
MWMLCYSGCSTQPVDQACLYYGSRIRQGRQARQEVAADSRMLGLGIYRKLRSSEKARRHACGDEKRMQKVFFHGMIF